MLDVRLVFSMSLYFSTGFLLPVQLRTTGSDSYEVVTIKEVVELEFYYQSHNVFVMINNMSIRTVNALLALIAITS